MAEEAVTDSQWIAIVALSALVLLLLLLGCCYCVKRRKRQRIGDLESAPAGARHPVATDVKSTTDIFAPPQLQDSSLLKQSNVNYGTNDANDMPTQLERVLEAPFIDVPLVAADSSKKSRVKDGDDYDDDTHSSVSSEVAHIIDADKDVRLSTPVLPPPRKSTTSSKGRTMSLLTPDLYGSVRALYSADAEGMGEDDDNAGAGKLRSKCRTPRPVIATDEPIVYGKHDVQLDVLHLSSLDEVVIRVKQGRGFDRTQTYAMLVTVENSATQKSRTLETAHIGGLEQPRWNEQIVFGGIKESYLEDVTITVVVIRKDANDLWEDEGHIVLSEVSPHSSGRIHFMQMMAKDGSASPRWHRVAINLP